MTEAHRSVVALICPYPLNLAATGRSLRSTVSIRPGRNITAYELSAHVGGPCISICRQAQKGSSLTNGPICRQCLPMRAFFIFCAVIAAKDHVLTADNKAVPSCKEKQASYSCRTALAW